MRERDPFKRASRRILRRLGRHHEILIKPPLGEWLKVDAVPNQPMLDVEITGGGKGGQDLQMRQPHVVIESRHCVDIELEPESWSVKIDGVEYYVTKPYAKDDGVTYLFLNDQPDETKQSPEGEGRGRTWC